MQRIAGVEERDRTGAGFDFLRVGYRVRVFDQSDRLFVWWHAVVRRTVKASETLELIEGAFFLEDMGKTGECVSGRKSAAQPQALSLLSSLCGALSVPRKNRGLPEVAAARNAFWCDARFTTGRQ